MLQHVNVPKVIYFIWAGGISPLPPIGAEIISSWAKSCPNFEIHLLVDETTAGKSLENLVENYKIIFKMHQIDILANSDEVRIHVGNAPIILKDIKREGLRNELVTYEIEQLIPNYGASSDLIRYDVLSRGGCYFDGTDVKPRPDQPLERVEIFSNLTTHILYVDYLAQNPRPNSLELAKFNFNTIGNDSFIATANNPLMKKISDAAKMNYALNINNIGMIINHAHASHHPRFITISRTGPGLVRQTINKIFTERDRNHSAKIDNVEVELKSLRNSDRLLCQPADKNTRLWLKGATISIPITAGEAIRKVCKAIDFEVTHFHYLRLDYHAALLARALTTSSKICIPQQALFFIKNHISSKKEEFFKEIAYVPLLGTCTTEILEICNRHKLSTIFDFDVDTMIRTLQIESNKKEITSGIEDIKVIQSTTHAKESLAQIETDIKEGWSEKIQHGIKYLEFMFSMNEKFKPDETAKFGKEAKEILALYKEFNTLLGQCFPQMEIYKNLDPKILALEAIAIRFANQALASQELLPNIK